MASVSTLYCLLSPDGNELGDPVGRVAVEHRPSCAMGNSLTGVTQLVCSRLDRDAGGPGGECEVLRGGNQQAVAEAVVASDEREIWRRLGRYLGPV